jgi:hypothetical protein
LVSVNDLKILRERTVLRLVIGAILALVLGVGFLYWAGLEAFWKGHETWQNLVRELGHFLVVTVVVASLWEIWGRRAFLDEVYARLQISREVERAGIVQVVDTFHETIDWAAFFESSTSLDVVVSYARTWRATHLEQLRGFVSKGGRLSVVLPDPSDEKLVEQLAVRFEKKPSDLQGLIKEAVSDFGDLAKLAREQPVHVAVVSIAPVFSFYRFDRVAILAFYTHDRRKSPVPTIICRSGGTLFDFISREWEALMAAGTKVAA